MSGSLAGEGEVAALPQANGQVPRSRGAAEAVGALVQRAGHAAVVRNVRRPLPLGLLLLQAATQGAGVCPRP